MQSIKKILWLIKSKSSFNVIFFFVLQKLKNIFLKNKIKKFKREHQNFISQKKITSDFFSAHAFFFYDIASKIKNDFKFLEIGSYEGNSAIFMAKNFNRNKIMCVDYWEQTNEYKKMDFNSIEKNFDFNTQNFHNIKKIKNTSDNFFKGNNDFFDMIYIDGHHHGDQVYKDCKNSWKILNKDGFMICDDFIWPFYDNIEENPCYAINKFLSEIRNEFKIIRVSNSQIFMQKMVRPEGLEPSTS